MNMKVKFKLLNLLMVNTINMVIFPSLGFAIVQNSKRVQNLSGQKRPKEFVRYLRDVNKLHTNLPLQISAQPRTLTLPDQDVLTRLKGNPNESMIEPIQLTVSESDDSIIALAGKLAKPGKKLSLAHYLRENRERGEEIPDTKLRLVSLDSNIMNLISRDEFDQMFAKEHYKLTIGSNTLKNSNRLTEKFLSQLSAYLSKSQIENIRRKIQRGSPLDVDTEVLPQFAKEVVAAHTVFKGPNCFHAALSFQGPDLARSQFVNVREEPGYHRDMINYDELWRIVQLEFYEIDPSRIDMQYGDMVLFFDAPKKQETFVDFKSLRHASTYLFGGYAFAKGSKSANSPYIIRPLVDEWVTWTKYTENLGVKVFRRNLKHVKNGPPWDPQDWMY